jgi:hypothetical protein
LAAPTATDETLVTRNTTELHIPYCFIVGMNPESGDAHGESLRGRIDVASRPRPQVLESY